MARRSAMRITDVARAVGLSTRLSRAGRPRAGGALHGQLTLRAPSE